MPTRDIYEHLKAYINARSNNINSSETDTERVQKLASTTANLISNLVINAQDSDCEHMAQTQLNAVYALYNRDTPFRARAFPRDYNPEWAAKIVDLLKRARHGTILNNFYAEKTQMDNNDPNLLSHSEASATFLQERYALTRFLAQLRTWFRTRVQAIMKAQCFIQPQSNPDKSGEKTKSVYKDTQRDKRKANVLKDGLKADKPPSADKSASKKPEKYFCNVCGNEHRMSNLKNGCGYQTRNHPDINGTALAWADSPNGKRYKELGLNSLQWSKDINGKELNWESTTNTPRYKPK